VRACCGRNQTGCCAENQYASVDLDSLNKNMISQNSSFWGLELNRIPRRQLPLSTRGTSASTVTGLQDEQKSNPGSTPDKNKIFHVV